MTLRSVTRCREMVSEDSNASGASISQPIVITEEDLESEKSWHGTARRALGGYRGYKGYLKGALIPALVGGLLVGLLLSNAGTAVAWTGGVLVTSAILGLTILAGHKGWMKLGIPDPRATSDGGAQPTTPPLVLPAVIIRPEDIPTEPESVAEASSAIAMDRGELEPEAAMAEDEARCPFCGESLGDGVPRTCRHCKTPHHRECWQANKGCTTLGCRSAPRR